MVGARLGGHFVQGHVDAVGRVLSLLAEADAIIAKYAAPPEVMHYIVEKGFIAVDGVSLTINSFDNTSFTVSLVTYSREHTILGSRRTGDPVNLEVDIIAKYVEKLREKRGGITIDFLAESGFLSSSQI
jgi:riboflavin synthase